MLAFVYLYVDHHDHHEPIIYMYTYCDPLATRGDESLVLGVWIRLDSIKP